MTRKEEIELVASCHIADETSKYQEFYDGFIAGAKWADETMIEKVCEWLKKNRDELSRVNTSGFIELFKKAMEL